MAADGFDLCIIGSGSGAFIIDERFAHWRIALVERGIGERAAFGGTCLNAGCIPSKMCSYPATLSTIPDAARHLDIDMSVNRLDFAATQTRILARIDANSDRSEAHFAQTPNVTLFKADAQLVDAQTVDVAEDTIRAEQIVLAAGSRPFVPNFEGRDDPDLASLIFTSESIMRISHLPRRLVIIGGGVEAVEFGHIFAGFGSQVTLIARGPALLRREDTEIAERATELLSRRCAVRTGQLIQLVEANPGGGLIVVAKDQNGIEYNYPADALLLCLGRVPNGDQLRVERAGVATDERGFVQVDAHQRTCVPNIWALGDICSPHLLKHVANHEARVVQHNLLHPTDLMASHHQVVPHGIFAEPEIASVGATEQDLRTAGVRFVKGVRNYSSVAMGWAMADSDHFAKVLVDIDSDQLLGAHIIGPQACALLAPLSQAMTFGTTVAEVARGQYWVHPALTEVVENALLDAEAARRAALSS